MEKIASEHAYAKLTRTLRVTGVRDDGYHLIDAEMISLDLHDTLIFGTGSGLVLEDAIDWTPDGPGSTGGFPVPADGSNLVVRALDLADARAQVRLIKRIPAGAGLGGGSADAAAVLRHLGLRDLASASSLGADVPFCIAGGRARVTGIGDEIERLADQPLAFVVVTPDFGVSTVEVYRTYDQLGSNLDPAGRNDLTQAALMVEPRLNHWCDLVRESTGREVVLAGSGSSLFVECSPDEREELAARVRGRVNEHKERALVSPTMAVRSSSDGPWCHPATPTNS